MLRTPGAILFGKGQRGALGWTARAIGLRALACTDERMGADPIFAGMMDDLKAAGVTVRVYDRTLPELPLRCIEECVESARDFAPDVIIGVDYGGFNLRFAKAIRAYARAHRNLFSNWNPKIVQFVSPQVWASRASRAYTLAENHDLLLSIFPFEQAWYAQRVPGLRVEFVGHPMVGRSLKSEVQSLKSEGAPVVSLSSLSSNFRDFLLFLVSS